MSAEPSARNKSRSPGLRLRRPPAHPDRERVGSSVLDDGLPTMRHVYSTEAKRVIRSDSRTEIEAEGEAEGDVLLASEAGGGSLYGSVRPVGASGSIGGGKPSALYGGRDPDECAGQGELCALWVLVTSKWVNLLLIFVPLAQASVWLQWSDTTTFVLNFLAMVPLAAILGDFTEEVSEKIGETAGGLMNASFGNAPELVFSLQALRANQLRVVQASLLGSILSNLLLVLGSSFFAGGLFSGQKLQRFNPTSAVANTSLLLVSSLALLLPTPIASYYEASNADVLLVSRVAACFMLCMYLQMLVFQFRTHKFLFEDVEKSASSKSPAGSGSHTNGVAGLLPSTPPSNKGGGTGVAEPFGVGGGDDEDEDEDEGRLKLSTSVLGLCVVTLLVAVYSDNLVDSLDGFVATSELSKTFVGIVLIPIIGNVVEHIVAVTVAIKDKMELSMGIAVGSACQVSMFVIPTAVVIGWAMDRDLSLNFPPFELMVYIMCVLIVSHLVSSGQSNWLVGSMLVTAYVFIALAFWFERVKKYRVT